MATTTTRPMTFEEFVKLREPERFRYELHHGELVKLPFPKMPHLRVQERLQDLLKKAAPRDVVMLELGFVALPEYEYRRADVAYVPRERWDAIRSDDFFHGAPDVVIEVLSPSNTAAEMRDKRKLCLANGSSEFWVVDPEQREIEVSTPDGHSVIYGPGSAIPLFFAPGASIAVDAVFAD